ncbi:MAG: rubredoxin [Candidatus Methanomethylophilaceae archaeon]|nr:rubredoxin [Candidatus Methanomethylophilaceae archaeon]
MSVYVCMDCGYRYDESAEGVPFTELPDDWVCPLCGSPKSAFAKLADGQ